MGSVYDADEPVDFTAKSISDDKQKVTSATKVISIDDIVAAINSLSDKQRDTIKMHVECTPLQVDHMTDRYLLSAISILNTILLGMPYVIVFRASDGELVLKAVDRAILKSATEHHYFDPEDN